MRSTSWILAVVALSLELNCSEDASAEYSYAALRDGTWQVYRQSKEGAQPRQVSEQGGGDASAPSLSPDGSVAFESSGGSLLVCQRGRCQTVRPHQGSAVRPAWNPMTNELIFANFVVDGSREESELLMVSDDLRQIRPLLTQTGNQDDPDVSLDGRKMVYSSSQTVSPYRGGVQVVRQLWVMDLMSGETRQVLLGSSQDIHPDWSPSGEQIAFASDRSGQFEIWVVNADGSGAHPVTSGEGAKTWPAWSPDGQSIMFTLADRGRMDLWIVDADGSNLRPFRPFGKDADIQTRDADWR